MLVPQNRILPFPEFSWSDISLYCRQTDAVCTGHGSCLLKDPSGNPIQSCSAFDKTCTASCSCDTGYGGRDCSLNELAVTSRDSLRYCYHCMHITRNQSLHLHFIHTLEALFTFLSIVIKLLIYVGLRYAKQ